jgi:single-stranded-DNA-specific exonuclease
MPDCPVIDPKARDSRYPFGGLSGCGVAFKTAHVLRSRHFADNEELRSSLNRMLDLVAIATIADVVPLTNENRTLVKYGLAELNMRRRPAAAELAAAIGLKDKITAYNVAFGIAPHINAAGRMEAAAPVAELFTSKDAGRRAEIITGLIHHNTERRALQEQAFQECMELADTLLADNPFLLLKPRDIHEGVAGIVAGKLKGVYNRPCAVLSRVADNSGETPQLKGSARSIEGVDIIGMLKLHTAMFDKLGGHAMAAGFTLPAAGEQALRDALNADMRELIAATPDLLERKLNIEARISAAEATSELAKTLDAFEPTGSENPRPHIAVTEATVSGARRIGSDGKHLSFTADGLKCIIFGATDEEFERVTGGARLSFAGRLEINRWNGTETAQLIVESVLK